MSWLNVYQGKKVFITGHTGFKGAWLSQWLMKLGADVVGYSKDIPTNPSLFEALHLTKQMKDFRGDIRDQSNLEKSLAAAKPDIVFHLAAQPLVRASYDNPLDTFQENTFGTAQVLEAVRRQGNVAAMVVITTDKVYENHGWEYGYRETDHLGGYDPYSASKAAAEIIISSYTRSFFSTGTRISSVRAGNVIGGGDWAKDRLVPDCIRAWTASKPVEIRNPTFTRPWEHVLEPLGGYLRVGQRLLESPEGIHGEAFNFGPTGEVERSTKILVEEMAKRWPGAAHKMAGAQDPTKKEAVSLRLNCDRAAHRLDWTPSLNFAETVAWTADWYLRHFQKDTGLADFTLSQISQFEAKLFAPRD